MQKNLNNVCKIVAKAARKITTVNANSTCDWLLHQPKLPESAKQLRKF